MKLTQGPILIIDNDRDDHELIGSVLTEINSPYPVRPFYSATDALEYLLTTAEQPFLILCDVEMPLMNGFELRQIIEDTPQLKSKGIPFICFTDYAYRQQVEKAYELAVQGFFHKPHSYEDLKSRIERIINYWKDCLHPYLPTLQDH